MGSPRKRAFPQGRKVPRAEQTVIVQSVVQEMASGSGHYLASFLRTEKIPLTDIALVYNEWFGCLQHSLGMTMYHEEKRFQPRARMVADEGVAWISQKNMRYFLNY